jgi:hypothetical protein
LSQERYLVIGAILKQFKPDLKAIFRVSFKFLTFEDTFFVRIPIYCYLAVKTTKSCAGTRTRTNPVERFFANSQPRQPGAMMSHFALEIPESWQALALMERFQSTP